MDSDFVASGWRRPAQGRSFFRASLKSRAGILPAPPSWPKATETGRLEARPTSGKGLFRQALRPHVAVGGFAPVNWGLAPASLPPGSDPIGPRSSHGEKRGTLRRKTARGVRASIAKGLFTRSKS